MGYDYGYSQFRKWDDPPSMPLPSLWAPAPRWWSWCGPGSRRCGRPCNTSVFRMCGWVRKVEDRHKAQKLILMVDDFMILMVDDLMVDDLMCWWSNHQPSKFGVPVGTQECLGNCGSHMEPGTQSCLDNSKVAGCSDSHGVGMKLFSYSKLFMVQGHSFLNRADWLAHSHSTFG